MDGGRVLPTSYRQFCTLDTLTFVHITPGNAAAVAHLGQRGHAASEDPGAAPRGRSGPTDSAVLARLQRGRSRPRWPPITAG